MQYEKALKHGSVEIRINKCLVLGITGVGKTHFEHLLLNLPIQGSIGSTPLSEHPIQALVGSLNSSLSYMLSDKEDDGHWKVVDREELLSIVAGAIELHVDHQPVPASSEELPSQSSTDTSDVSEVPNLNSNAIPPPPFIAPIARDVADRVLI